MSILKHLISTLRIEVGRFRRSARELPARYPQYQIGRGCYGPLEIDTFGDSGTVRIGAFCSFAKGTAILLGGEHHPEWVSTFPFDRRYFSDPTLPHSSFARGDVVIGNDVWTGRDTLILSGATVGDGVIIGARSVVRGVLPPYSICVGSPAKVIKFRFPPETVDQLLALKWWDWPDEKIRAAGKLLLSNDVSAFLAWAMAPGAEAPPTSEIAHKSS